MLLSGTGIDLVPAMTVKPLVHRGEAELKRQVLDAVAGVVDVDLVEAVGVHGEIVRTCLRFLQALVVGDEGDETGPAGFVAVEHVEVGAVDLGTRGDERCLAVTGGYAPR